MATYKLYREDTLVVMFEDDGKLIVPDPPASVKEMTATVKAVINFTFSQGQGEGPLKEEENK